MSQRLDRAESFFAATPALIHGGNRAYYAAGSDHIQTPPFESLRDAENYHATPTPRELPANLPGDVGATSPRGAAFLSATPN
jgi:antirestriction protein ArdC